MAFLLAIAVSTLGFAQENNTAVEGGGAAQPAAAVMDEAELLLDDVPPADEAVRAPSSFWAAVRMVVVLAFAAAAIYGVVFFLKKMARPAEGKDPFLKVLASVHLGSNRFVHVVSLGEKAWIVGAADGGVSSLGEVEDKETLDALFLEESRRAAEGGSRIADFKSMLRKFGAREPEDGASGMRTSTDSLRQRRERLRGL